MYNQPYSHRWQSVALFVSATVLATICDASLAQNQDAEDATWLAESDLVRIKGGQVDRFTAKGDIQALAIDDRELVLWAVTDTAITAYDFNGQPQKSLPAPNDVGDSLGLRNAINETCDGESEGSSPIASIDRVHGDIWLARDGSIWKIEQSGRTSRVAANIPPVRGMAFDPDSSTLFAASCDGVTRFDRGGGVIGKLHLPMPIGQVRDIDIDARRGLIWTAGAYGALVLERNGGYIARVPVDARIVRSAGAGEAWIASGKELARIDSSGSILQRESFANIPADIHALATHPSDKSVWAISGSTVIHLSADGRSVLYNSATRDVPIQSERALAVYSDTIPPDLAAESELSDEDRIRLRLSFYDIGRGVDTNSLVVRVDGNAVDIQCSFGVDKAECDLPSSGRRNPREIETTISDFARNRSSVATIRLADLPEPADATRLISMSPSQNGSSRIVGLPGSVQEAAMIVAENLRTRALAQTRANQVGAFELTLQALDGDEIEATVAHGNRRTNALRRRVGEPPRPAFRSASRLPSSRLAGIGEANAFLYAGSRPVQFAMKSGTVDPERAAVVRGMVADRQGAAIPGATVSVAGHPEYGYGVTDAYGEYSLAIEGGGPIVIDIRKDGLIPSQRQIDAPWQDYVVVPVVTLLEPSPNGTNVVFGASSPMQVVMGDLSTDSSGQRRAVLIFQPNTTASLIMPDGSTQGLAGDVIRLTEFTVGNSGLSAMPGNLPPSSAYTYAVDMTGDQQLAVGAKTMQFSTPPSLYLDNFLDFPVGKAVPMGNYDGAQANWVPSDNGRIVKVLSIAGGVAELDVDGSGSAASAATLQSLGITTQERGQLASLYSVGAELWRVPVPHFCPWDPNFPYGLPGDGVPPNQPRPDDVGLDGTDHPRCRRGSIIECENQVLGESIPVPGTPFTLNYRSNRVEGQSSNLTATIPLTGPSVPGSLKRVEAGVFIAGRAFAHTYAASTNQKLVFTWDGKDYADRTVQGHQLATVHISYVYDGEYSEPGAATRSFGLYGAALSVGASRREFVLTQKYQITLGTFDSRIAGLGGWTLSPHHVYDPIGRTLYRGDGSTVRQARSFDQSAITSDGTAPGGYTYPEDIVSAPNGDIYLAAGNYIKRVGMDGLVTPIAGGGSSTADGALATQARLYGPKGLALGKDGTIFFTGTDERIRKVAPDGRVYTVAGNGLAGNTGDNGPATQAKIASNIGDLSVGPDGSIYFISGDYIRSVTPDGIIHTVAGNGQSTFSGDGGLAKDAGIDPSFMTMDGHGNIYFSGHYRIRKISPDGIVRTVAGTGQTSLNTSFGDGGPALAARVTYSGDLLALDDGSFYFTTNGPYGCTVRYVDGGGVINTVIGKRSGCVTYNPTSPVSHPMKTALGETLSIALRPSGEMVVSDYYNKRLVTFGVSNPGFQDTEFDVASSDGSELYRFDSSGRHLSTRHTLTGNLKYSFGYASGWLTNITDGDGNVTQIQRDSLGQPTTIVAPFGQATGLIVNGDRYITDVLQPGPLSYTFDYYAGGLLKSFTDPRGLTTAFSYDAFSRLHTDIGPDGYSSTLVRTSNADGHTVSITSAEGRLYQHKVAYPDSGGELLSLIEPSGVQSTVEYKSDGSSIEIHPDGTTVTTVKNADPRFGMQSPYVTSISKKMPSGLTSTATATRAVTFSSPGDNLSIAQLVETATVNGKTWQNVFDAATKTHTITSPMGRVSALTIDGQGRPSLLQAPGVAPIVYSYDAYGRPQDVDQTDGLAPRNRHYSYRSDGRLESISDPMSRTVLLDYDAAGRAASITLPGSRVIAVGRDENGNPTSITPPGRPEHSISYTAGNLEDLYTPPSVPGTGAIVSDSIYNLDRQRISLTRPDGQTVSAGFGASTGRLDTLTIPSGYPNAGSVGLSYSPTTGKLAGIGGPSGASLSFVFDGRLLKSETLSGPVQGMVAYVYNSDLQVSKVTIAGTGISFGYDSDGLLTSAGAETLTRDVATGFLSGTSVGSITSTYTYNGFGETASGTYMFGTTTLMETTYSRDALGRLVDVGEAVAGSTRTIHYDYHPEGWLEAVTVNGLVVETYEYDANGNRTVANGMTATYDDQDRLTSFDGASYTYSANGELSSRSQSGQTNTFAYDAYGNLIEASVPGKSISYIVDGRNRRVGKRVNGALVQGFLYAGELEPVAEVGPSQQIVSRFVYGSKSHVPDYMIKGSVTYRIVSDHLGSVRLVVDTSTGVVAQEIRYDAWGRVIFDSSPGFQPFGYAGGLYDSDTKLVRFGWRDYDPHIGRWTAKDPIRFAGGDTNIYAYAGSDPINNIDPTGLELRRAEEVAAILAEVRGSNLLMSAVRLTITKEWDFAINFEYRFDTFEVPGVPQPMSPSEFGNYVAGYAGAYHGGYIGIGGAVVGGMGFDLLFNGLSWPLDAEDRPTIARGALAGLRDRDKERTCK
ncbi:RHS repeat-associated core domain-containing protein [Sinimarinibacterium flocculans]|uniref:RHS repeat-associated core domain-containing protein n=1 Tax=Sinimarinibacterium flocculans TaxID=985250 RepID=UPI003514A9E0